MIPIRSLIRWTWSSRWDEKKIVIRRSRLRPWIRSSIRFVPSGSRPIVGSSRKTTFGSLISTSAIPRRCRIPFE